VQGLFFSSPVIFLRRFPYEAGLLLLRPESHDFLCPVAALIGPPRAKPHLFLVRLALRRDHRSPPRGSSRDSRSSLKTTNVVMALLPPPAPPPTDPPSSDPVLPKGRRPSLPHDLVLKTAGTGAALSIPRIQAALVGRICLFFLLHAYETPV